jgi:hypothetical protein
MVVSATRFMSWHYTEQTPNVFYSVTKFTFFFVEKIALLYVGPNMKKNQLKRSFKCFHRSLSFAQYKLFLSFLKFVSFVISFSFSL